MWFSYLLRLGWSRELQCRSREAQRTLVGVCESRIYAVGNLTGIESGDTEEVKCSPLCRSDRYEMHKKLTTEETGAAVETTTTAKRRMRAWALLFIERPSRNVRPREFHP